MKFKMGQKVCIKLKRFDGITGKITKFCSSNVIYVSFDKKYHKETVRRFFSTGLAFHENELETIADEKILEVE